MYVDLGSVATLAELVPADHFSTCGTRDFALRARASACEIAIRMQNLLECCRIHSNASPSHAGLVHNALRASLRMRNRPIRMRKRHSQETCMRISCDRMKIFCRDMLLGSIQCHLCLTIGFASECGGDKWL